MRTKFARTVALATVLGVACALPARAWNGHGHMLVADIAFSQLSDTAKARVSDLLKLNPQYEDWVSGIADEDRDEVAFMMASKWPDFIKRAPEYTNDGEHPSGPDLSRNIGYDDKLMHKYWHYIDLPFSPDDTPLVDPQEPNAETQIATFRDTLSSPTASDPLKSYDLVWIIHLVGDVHQPLHATSRFIASLPKGDNGGNLIYLCTANSCKGELHAFWDGALGSTERPASVEKAAKEMAPAEVSLAAVSDELKWVKESFEAAETTAYATPIGPGEGPFTLTESYKVKAGHVAEARAALAGARLAKLLNDAFH